MGVGEEEGEREKGVEWGRGRWGGGKGGKRKRGRGGIGAIQKGIELKHF